MGAEQAVIEGYVSAAPRIKDVAWSQIRYDVDAVRQIGAPAALWSAAGDLWEYEGGRFFLTELTGDRRRRWVADDRHVPPGPWRHYADCVCEVCRLGNA